MHSNFSIIDFNVIMSECGSSGVLEPELASLARLLALLGICDGKSQNLGHHLLSICFLKFIYLFIYMRSLLDHHSRS